MKFKCRECEAVYILDKFEQDCPVCGAHWTSTFQLLFDEPVTHPTIKPSPLKTRERCY